MRSPFNDDTKQAIAAQLQPIVVELTDLALIGKQFHWTVTGRSFKPLHLQLDEFVDAYRTWTDEVAERLAAVGVAPDGRSQTIASRTPQDEVNADWIKDSDVVSELSGRIEAAIGRVRAAMDELDKVDLASQDVLIGIVKGLEEQLWMLSTQEV